MPVDGSFISSFQKFSEESQEYVFFSEEPNKSENECKRNIQDFRPGNQMYHNPVSPTDSKIMYLEVELPDKFEISPFFALSFFSSSMFATVLEDTLLSFNILSQCNCEIRVHKAIDDMPELLSRKYMILPSSELDELAELRTGRRLDCDAFKLNKLERDRNECMDVLTESYLNQVLARGFRPLFEHVAYKDYMRNYFPLLKEQEAQQKVDARSMMKQCRQQRNQNKRILYDVDGLIAKLQSQIEDADQTAAIEGRYVDRWQASRTEQQMETISRTEGAKMNNIDSFKRMVDQESRVHHEIETLLAISISEKMAETELWMTKYDDDMEEMDLRIQIRRSEYENMWERRRELERTMSRHDRQMREWIKFKDERAAAQKYADTMLQSAIIVQAWWRGILVRLQLGPYRPKKKAVGGKKKK